MRSFNRPTAFVLNMFGTGLGIARNLGEYGIPVVGISSRADAPGNSSRYCETLISPDSQDEPEKLVDFLTALGKNQEQRSIIFPTRDEDVIFLDRYRDTLAPFFAIPQPEHELLDLILNKERLARKAESIGIGTPRTLQVSSLDELDARQSELVFPIVAKPVYAFQWRLSSVWDAVGKRKGVKIETFEALRRWYVPISQYQKDVLIQEWVPGEEDQFFILGAYFSHESKCIGAFTAQKIVQFPPIFGLGSLVKSVHNEDVMSLGLRMLESLNFTGTAEVEFKRDGKTGEYRLIEINPRHWDQHRLGTACGVNLSYLAYLDHIAQTDPAPVTQKTADQVWVSGNGMIGCIKEDLRHGKCEISKILSLFPLGGKVYAVWDWRDVAPFCRMVSQSFLKKVTSLGRGR